MQTPTSTFAKGQTPTSTFAKGQTKTTESVQHNLHIVIILLLFIDYYYREEIIILFLFRRSWNEFKQSDRETERWGDRERVRRKEIISKCIRYIKN